MTIKRLSEERFGRKREDCLASEQETPEDLFFTGGVKFVKKMYARN